MREVLLTLAAASVLRFALQVGLLEKWWQRAAVALIVSLAIVPFGEWCRGMSVVGIESAMSGRSAVEDLSCVVMIDFVFVAWCLKRRLEGAKWWSRIPSVLVVPSGVYLYDYLLFMQMDVSVWVYALGMTAVVMGICWAMRESGKARLIGWISAGMAVVMVCAGGGY